MQVAFVLFDVTIAIAIALYSTWLFFERLRSGAPITRSFGEWLKNLFDSVWGLS
jgi:hypothetical protein